MIEKNVHVIIYIRSVVGNNYLHTSVNPKASKCIFMKLFNVSHGVTYLIASEIEVRGSSIMTSEEMNIVHDMKVLEVVF